MTEFLNPDKADLIREAIIVFIGFIMRFIELRKIKKHNID